MFGKTRRSTPEIRTLIGSDTRITGDLAFCEGLHVDGVIVGNVSVEGGGDANLSISKDGLIEGSVEVPEVVLNGTVKGNVIASERVQLGATARVVGNVVYNLIEMAIGAEVNGQLIHKAPGRPDVMGSTAGSDEQSADSTPAHSLETG